MTFSIKFVGSQKITLHVNLLHPKVIKFKTTKSIIFNLNLNPDNELISTQKNYKNSTPRGQRRSN